jgi:hypothetical protein
MPLSEETKERWVGGEKRYATIHAKREKNRHSAAMKELENQERRRIKAQQQREAAKANTYKPTPPITVNPIVVRKREMLSRMGNPADNPNEIRKAWKRLALLYHPDKCGGQDTKFKSILEAYEFLMK